MSARPQRSSETVQTTTSANGNGNGGGGNGNGGDDVPVDLLLLGSAGFVGGTAVGLLIT